MSPRPPGLRAKALLFAALTGNLMRRAKGNNSGLRTSTNDALRKRGALIPVNNNPQTRVALSQCCSERSTHLTDVGSDITITILLWLDLRSLCRMGSVCKYMSHHYKLEFIWKEWIERTFGTQCLRYIVPSLFASYRVLLRLQRDTFYRRKHDKLLMDLERSRVSSSTFQLHQDTSPYAMEFPWTRKRQRVGVHDGSCRLFGVPLYLKKAALLIVSPIRSHWIQSIQLFHVIQWFGYSSRSKKGPCGLFVCDDIGFDIVQNEYRKWPRVAEAFGVTVQFGVESHNNSSSSSQRVERCLSFDDAMSPEQRECVGKGWDVLVCTASQVMAGDLDHVLLDQVRFVSVAFHPLEEMGMVTSFMRTLPSVESVTMIALGEV